MYKLHSMDAVHDILKRVIESNLDDLELTSLIKELKSNGYEEKNMIVTVTRKVHQEGDIIAITKDKYDALPEHPDDHRTKLSIEDQTLADAKQTIKYIYDGEKPVFPIKAELQSLRLGNDYGHLIAVWFNIPFGSPMKQTNIHFLEDLGFEFEQPTFDVIPIIEADNSLLDTSDQIVKYLMKGNEWTEEQALDYLKPVLGVMDKVGAVFYQP